MRWKAHVDDHVRSDSSHQDRQYDTNAHPINLRPVLDVLHDGRVALLLEGGRKTTDQQRGTSPHVCVQHIQRGHAIDPHHCRSRISHDAARATSVRGRDDGRKVAEVHAPEERMRHCATYHRARDVVEKRRQDEDDREQEECALPVIRQHVRQCERHVTLLEVTGEQCETEQQTPEVSDDYPLVSEMTRKAVKPHNASKRPKGKLVEGDRAQAGDGDFQRSAMEKGHAEECECEERKIDGEARQGRLALRV